MSVSAETSEKILADAELAAVNADVIEIRIDALAPAEIRQVLGSIRSEKPLLITFRPAEQGGAREISLERRIEFWDEIEAALDTSGLWFDQEADLLGHTQKQHNSVTIRSFHDFGGVPDNIDAIFDSLAADAEVVKIAVSATDITDAIPVWKLLDRAKAKNRQLIPIAMGEAGKWTRILGLAHGAFMTYASLVAGKETADGQITAKDLIETYRVKELDENTQVFGVIGHPTSQSLSPYMHNPAFASAGMNAVFIPFLIKDLDKFMRRMVMPQTREVELNFGGFSVTMPHKQAIMKFLDVLDPVAEKIGAVNTVKIENGKLTGYNTDAHGFITPLKAKYGDVKGARVAVLGAGGAARACVHALKQEGADVTVFARDPKMGSVFAEEFAARFTDFSKIKDQKSKIGIDFEIIVNATPLGMKGQLENESPFTADQLAGVKFVYDLVTKTADTLFILEAQKAGIPAIGGLEMLIAQGARQFEIWTGKKAPVDLMRESLISRIQAKN